MAGRLTKAVRDMASRSGVVVNGHSKAEDQRPFFSALKPVRTEHALIRIGGEGDGGYLVPDDLDGIAACFSPGVDRVATFEQDMLDRGMRTFQIDASIEDSPLKHERNDFERKYLGIVSDGQTITLDDWVSTKLPGSADDLILQMDIEGHEWLTLAQASEATLRRFRIVVLELHFLDRIFDRFGPIVFTPVLEKLRRTFDIVHIHANNIAPIVHGPRHDVAPLIEMTLLRKDRSMTRLPIDILPHGLDRDNVPGLPPVAVPPSMYA